jgi:putative ABC transport system permease protein
MKRLLAVTYLQGIFTSALSEDMTDQATEEITALLRSNHKLKEVMMMTSTFVRNKS